MSFIKDFLGGKAAKKAAASAKEASGIAAGAKTDALKYLQEKDVIPSRIKEGALTGLEEYYGANKPKTQAELIAEAKSSPLYASIIGSRKSGEDAILRNASATGGLRSGNSNAALSDFNINLENEALLKSYNQAQDQQNFNLSGLQGLANLPTNMNNIAQLTSDIGDTKAAGITAAAQAKQQGNQNFLDNLMGIGTLAASFSDLRLKRNIQFKEYRDGFAWYQWEWIPEAIKLGLQGVTEGVLAHHVYEKFPDAIGEAFGFLTVDYSKLGLQRAA